MSENDESFERLLTVKDVAALARICERTVWLLIEKGALRAVRPTGTRLTRIRPADFDDWLSRQRERRREEISA